MRVRDSEDLDQGERTSLSKIGNFNLWRQLLAKEEFRRLHSPEPKTSLLGPSVNYLVNEALYLRLRTLARAHHIRALLMDLKRDSEDFGTLMSDLRKKDIPVSVLDLSNAWYSGFIGPQRSWRLLRSAAKNARPDSVAIAVASHNYDWAYLGFNFASLADKDYVRAVAALAEIVDDEAAPPKSVPEAFVNQLNPDLIRWHACGQALGATESLGAN